MIRRIALPAFAPAALVGSAALLLSWLVYSRSIAPAGPLGWDEAYHALFALRIADDITRGQLIELAYDTYRQVYLPPLAAWYEGLWSIAFGASRVAFRVSSVAALAGCGLVMYLAGREALGSRREAGVRADRQRRRDEVVSGIAAALVVLTSAGVLTMASQVMRELPGLLALSLCFWLHNRTWRSPPAPSNAPYVWLGVAMAAAYLTRANYGVQFAAAFVLAVLVAGTGAEAARRRRGHLIACGVLAAILVVWFAYPAKLARTFAALVNQPYGPERSSLEGLLFYPKAMLPVVGSWPMLAAWLGALVFCLRRSVLAENGPARFSVIFLAFSGVLYEWGANKHERYLVPVAPAFAVLAGVAAAWSWGWLVNTARPVQRAAAVAALAAALVWHLLGLPGRLEPPTPPNVAVEEMFDAILDQARSHASLLIIGTRDIPGGPAGVDVELIASGVMSVDGAGSVVQGAEIDFVTRIASLPVGPMRAPLLELNRRYPGRRPGVTFTAFVGLPLVKPEVFSPANFGARAAQLVADQQPERIGVILEMPSARYPEMTPSTVTSALAAVGYEPDSGPSDRRFAGANVEFLGFRRSALQQ